MKRQHFFYPAFAALAATLLLSACGFSLRGSTGEFKLPFKTLYVSEPSTSYFGANLKRQLQSAGTTVVTDRKQADAALEILQREEKKETLSLSTAGRTREYALFYTFRYQVKDKEGRILQPPTEIRLRRTMTYSDSQAYAKEQEAKMLYQEMENDVMQQVIRRLTNLEVPGDPARKAEPPL